MGIVQLLAILWARRVVIAGCLLLTVAITGTVTMMLPKRYSATTVVQVDTTSKDPVSDELEVRLRMTEFLGREAALVSSKLVALEVVSALGLAKRPDYKERYLALTGGSRPIESWAAEQLRGRVDVRPSFQSSTLVISASAADPGMAATLANAFADAYQKVSVSMRVSSAEQSSQILGEQTPELQAQLAEAQRRLTAFQEKYDLVGAGPIDEEQAQLASLTNAMAAASATAQEAKLHQKLYDEGRAGGRDLNAIPEIQANGMVQGLRGEIARLNGDLADIKNRYGTSHPNYTASVARREAIQKEIEAEIDKVGVGLKLATEIAERRVQELDEAIAKQKRLVVALENRRSEYDILNKEVQARQNILNQVVQRSGMESLQSRLKNINVTTLTKAEAPIAPSFPNVPLNIGLAVFFGFGLGVIVALLLEFLNRRILTDEDLRYATGAPVLLALPRRANG